MHGELITSGSTKDSPLASFVQASVDGAAEDDQASLSVFSPQNAGPSSAWSGERLSGPTTYPNPGAPARVNGTVLPVVSGRPGDPSLAVGIAKHPSQSGVYQLRLYTSHSTSESASYAAADIAVNGDTWTQIYPAVNSTTITLTVTPPSWTPGTPPIRLISKLTPATVGGTVAFYDGARLLASLPDRAIQAFLGEIELSPGRHVLSATFKPNSTSFDASGTSIVYQASTSASVHFKVKKPKTPPSGDKQTITVVVPRTRVLGVRKTHKGPLSLTGAPVITLMVVGVTGLVTGLVVRSAGRRRRNAATPVEG
jgi:hypothetical protein